MPTFIPGLELSRRFYLELVYPLLDEHFPGLAHAAALIGYGSEVLGFDTEMSMDHAWCPRVLLFLREQDASLAGPIKSMLGRALPREFLGFPLDTVAVEGEPGVFWMKPDGEGPVDHKVVPVTLRAFIQETLDWDMAQPLTPVDWLSISSQLLATITAGAVHFDNVGELTALRAQLAWYPRDVWLYLLACGWARIGQEQHLMPRAGFVGDELGSALIGARLARDVMALCFLMEKRYAPYPKWFGSAFRKLACATQMSPRLERAQAAKTWQEREAALSEAYMLLAKMHNALGLTDPLPEQVGNFHGRPFKVIDAEGFSAAILAKIDDPQVRRIAAKGLIGGIDQFSDNTDLRSHVGWREGVCRLYE
ncbi:MAG: DUF4037 domain-containing protein [Anaerolineales bacterium]